MGKEQLLDGFILKEQMEKKTPYKPKKSEGGFGDLFKTISSVKIDSLKDIIQDINTLIITREHLKAEMFHDLENEKTHINNILQNVPIDASTQPQVIAEHLKLRQKLVDLNESKIQEKLNCWRDIALLKRELRENLREAQEKESNLGILDKLMTEE